MNDRNTRLIKILLLYHNNNPDNISIEESKNELIFEYLLPIQQ